FQDIGAGKIKSRQRALSAGTSMLCGELVPLQRFFLISRCALPVQIKSREMICGRRLSLIGCGLVVCKRPPVILCYSQSVFVEEADPKLRARMALTRCPSVPSGRFRIVLGDFNADEVARSQTIFRADVAPQRRLKNVADVRP